MKKSQQAEHWLLQVFPRTLESRRGQFSEPPPLSSPLPSKASSARSTTTSAALRLDTKNGSNRKTPMRADLQDEFDAPVGSTQGRGRQRPSAHFKLAASRGEAPNVVAPEVNAVRLLGGRSSWAGLPFALQPISWTSPARRLTSCV